ncbi:Uncharacterised protein [Mycobacteroides abscessus subsp. abscessus]|nr:Uncharacterised protein [Mycobacteroides abscessus subsp. abscessus]
MLAGLGVVFGDDPRLFGQDNAMHLTHQRCRIDARMRWAGSKITQNAGVVVDGVPQDAGQPVHAELDASVSAGDHQRLEREGA